MKSPNRLGSADLKPNTSTYAALATGVVAVGALLRKNRALKSELAAVREESQVDALTGLLNKEAWKQRLGEHMDAGKPFGVIFMDMDAFKVVNDTFGHETGDELLKQFGEQLRSDFRREGDEISHEAMIANRQTKPQSAGRYGGDEFGLIVDLEHRNGKTIGEIMALEIERLRNGVAEFVGQQDSKVRNLNFDVSVGGVIWEPGSHNSVSELLHAADIAMYENKTTRRR